MILIHPGFPKTGTTYLQKQLKDHEWFYGPTRRDAISQQLGEFSRKGSRSIQVLRDLVCSATSLNKLTLLSEEAILSTRPHEVSCQAGIYRNQSHGRLTQRTWKTPAWKLLRIADAFAGIEHAWLFTVRRHLEWCLSFWRYSLPEL